MSTQKLSAIATCVAVIAALDHLRSKELQMGTYYDKDTNRFCMKGALHDFTVAKEDTLFEQTHDPANSYFGHGINVDDVLASHGYDMEVLRDIERFGLDARHNDFNAQNRKKVFRQVRNYTLALKNYLEVLESNPALKAAGAKLKKAATYIDRYGDTERHCTTAEVLQIV